MHTTVTNDISPNTDLTVHCRSSNDDLGVHILHCGENVHWTFKSNIFGSKIFTYDLKWSNGNHEGFQVYNQEVQDIA